MKITTKQTIEKEVDVILPVFFKKTYHCLAPTYYAVISEDIGIINYSDRPDINNTSAKSVLQFYGTDEMENITAEEFTQAFDNSIEQLQSIKQLFFTKQNQEA